jgi:phospholipid transport system transporter-binding protein
VSQSSTPPQVFLFPGKLTHREAMAERERLVRAVAEGATLIDMSALTAFDSTALAVMLAALRGREGSVHPMSFEGVPGKLRDLARLYGLQEILADALS